MRRDQILTALVLGMALAPPVTAQDTAPPGTARVITFEDAVDLALDRNTDLLRARADLNVRGVVEDRERLDFVPNLSISTRGTRTFGRSFSPEEGEILSETNDILDGGVSASMTLFDGLENIASLQQASLQEDASRLRLDRTRQDVLFRVVEGFTSLLLARELAEVRQEELVAAGQLLEQVRRLVELGRQPLSDLYQQQAVHAEAEAALVEAQRQLELSETELMQVLELDPLGSYEFRTPDLTITAMLEEGAGAAQPGMGGAEPDAEVGGPDGAPAPHAASDYELGELLELALAHRPDLAASEAGFEASRHGLRAARSGYWPSLSISFNYGSNWSSNSLQPIPGTGSDATTVFVQPVGGGDPVPIEVPGSGTAPDFFEPGFTDQLDARRGGSVSLSLSVPLFNGFKTRAQVAQADLAQLNARYDLQDQRQQIALQVRQALLDHRSALAQLAASTRRLQAAQRAWQAAQRRYELGAATFVEVTQARSTLASARSAAVQARVNVLLADRMIAYHTGTLDAEDPVFTRYDEENR